MIQNKLGLIDYLKRNTKDRPWEQIASEFGYTAEGARSAWYDYRKFEPSGFVSSDMNIRYYMEQMEADKAKPAPFEFKEGDIKFSNILPQINKVFNDEMSKKQETKVTSFEEDLKSGEAQMQVASDQEIKSLDELITKTNIDLDKWNIVKWIQNFWNNKYQVKVWLEPKAANKAGYFQEKFVEFLSTYKPNRNIISVSYNPAIDNFPRTDSILIINKQDSHLNKYDVDGDNDIHERFLSYENALDKTLKKVLLSNNLSAIGYIIGSDQFNSEFTSATTKGTPQQNILDYHKAFQLICDHEVSIIENLAANTEEVHVVFLGGNHDEYVGWHMAKWLEAYFRTQGNIVIDASEEYTKYVQFGNTAMMFNHGDELKPEALATKFPIGAKDMWSDCEHRYIFTGDKHNNLTKDFGGIEFYQITQTSKAKSKWDKKKGYEHGTSEMTSFVITQNDGMSDIIKMPLK